MRKIIIMIGMFLLLASNVFADDVTIDSSGNVETGAAGGGNLDVTGASAETAILGQSSGTGGVGVYGVNSTSGNYGLLGYDSYGVYGFSSGGYAGYFDGNVHVTGNLTVQGSINVPENDPQVGTLTNRMWCTSNGSQINCTTTEPVTSESDPQVGSLTNGKWCTSTGTAVNCTSDAPSILESDPEVGSNTTNYVPKWNGLALVSGQIIDNGNVGIGTATPAAKLDVSGDINTSSAYKIGGNTVLSTPNYNTFLGNYAGLSNITGNDNTFLGSYAGNLNTTGFSNTFLGHAAGLRNTTGYANTFLGSAAGDDNTTGSDNTFIGNRAGWHNTTGIHNTFIGGTAGGDNTTGLLNTFIGYMAGSSNTEAWYNTFIGGNAGHDNTTGENNTFVGNNAGDSNIGGHNNIFLGSLTGSSNTTGYGNTFLGTSAGFANTTGTGNVFIGSYTGYNSTSSNKLYIDNSSTSSPLIYGDFSTNSVTINGSFSGTGAKNFIQPHAKDPSKEIVYIAAEAPEAIVMFRGTYALKDGEAVINLPEHFSVVAADEGLQVQVTPLEDCNGIFVKSKGRERIVIKEVMKGSSSSRFDYIVTAVRAGYEGHEPVAANKHFRPVDNETAEDFEARYSDDSMSAKAIRGMLISNGLLTKEGKLDTAKVKELGWAIAEKRAELNFKEH